MEFQTAKFLVEPHEELITPDFILSVTPETERISWLTKIGFDTLDVKVYMLDDGELIEGPPGLFNSMTTRGVS